MRYDNEVLERANGVVYTPRLMAVYLANKMRYYKNNTNAKNIRILDPAVGNGELIIALLDELRELKFKAKIEIICFDIDDKIIDKTTKRILDKHPQIKLDIKNEDFLKAVENSDNELGEFDYIIANPPYIRTQILGSKKAQELALKLNHSGRLDIYYAFIIYASRLLNADGIAGFIVSNKLLTIKSGSNIREYLKSNYLIHRITDFGDTKLFDASVLPCILIFSKGQTTENTYVDYTSVYQYNDSEILDKKTRSIFDAIDESVIVETSNNKQYRIKQGFLNKNNNELWTISSPQTCAWLERVSQKTWIKFGDLGKIKVGIKTTADNVFIKETWPSDEDRPELLKPLITHRNAGQFISSNNKMWQVLYTHEIKNGKKVPIDINNYPVSKRYLEKHRKQLESRKYVIDANRNWYEIWVPHNPAIWLDRKIVFRDISEKPQFWLDESGAIVNGDCYWIDIKNSIEEDIIYLALAVANSSFIEKYYDLRFNTKLYSNKRRYISQYVKEFPIPKPDNKLSKEAILIVKKILAISSDQTAICKYKEDLNIIIDKIFN